MVGNTSKTLPLTVTVPENNEDFGIIDVVDSYASVHATFVERDSIAALPSTWQNACGFYILFSPIREDGSYTTYVGKSDRDFTRRMRSHDEKKEDWVVALLIQRKSVESLSSTQSSFLEGAVRDIFTRARHVVCQNIARTGDSTLPEHEKAIMSQVVDSALRIMLLRGYRVTARKTVERNVSTSKAPVPPTLSGMVTRVPPSLSMTVPAQTTPVKSEPTEAPSPAPVQKPEPRKAGFSLFGKRKPTAKEVSAEDIYAALIEWRKEEAKKLHTKPWYVLEDYTLKALSEKRPLTYDALLDIPGIKEKKREKFGKDLLQVLSKFR